MQIVFIRILTLKILKLNSKIQEGLIDTDKTKFEWRRYCRF